MRHLAILVLALTMPVIVAAQPVAKVHRLGYLTPWPLPHASAEEFFAGLRELGYVEGQSIVLEKRSANLRFGDLQRLAAELVAQKVDIIVAASGTTALAAKRATSKVPIVVAASNDAVAMGIVDSLQRPGGNVTGVTGLSAQLAPKRLQILKEVLPAMKTVAVLWCPRARINHVELGHVEVAAKALGIAAMRVQYDEKPAAWVATLSEALQRGRPDAFFMLDCTSLPFESTVEFVRARGVPLIAPYANVTRMGGLLSYGADWGDMHRRVVPVLVDKVLKGADPGSLPFEQPTKFELVVNLRAAKALKLSLPSSLLLQATSVVE